MTETKRVIQTGTLLMTVLLIGACTSSTGDKEMVGQTQAVELSNAEQYTLTASQVRATINSRGKDMYGYNGQIPGPTLKVLQGSNITVNFRNDLDVPTTVHWHGIRLANRFDGVPDVTQNTVNPGESFTYELTFPDWGIYWYHPHVREDMQQEKGLYGAILVTPDTGGAPQEQVIFLDDIRLDGNSIEQFYAEANYALMGRFGNTMFVNGKTEYEVTARPGPLRLYLINSANPRTFDFVIPGQELTLIGKDSELLEHSETVSSVVLSPGERAIVELELSDGTYELQHSTPSATYDLGSIRVEGEPIKIGAPSVAAPDFSFIEEFADSMPDYEFDLTVRTSMGGGMMGHLQHGGAAVDAIEWEDTMPHMNAQSTGGTVDWIIRDRKTGRENMDIEYSVRQGDMRKIRIRNVLNSAHPMQHPIHLHGQRFVILAIDGRATDNPAWKDVALIPAGSTVDILVDFSNPGTWMMHCHIAEHLEAGMMTQFIVEEII